MVAPAIYFAPTFDGYLPGLFVLLFLLIDLAALIGVPIASAWFALRAPPLGPYPYHWGRFVGTIAIAIASVEVLLLLILPAPWRPAWYLPVFHFATAAGILMRRRFGPILVLGSIVLFVIRVLPSALGLNLLITVPILCFNAWYFSRRWKWMGWP